MRYIYGGIVVKNLAAGWTGAVQLIGGGINRTEPRDLTTTGSWFGSSLNMSVGAACGSNTTNVMTCYSGSVNNNKSGHTITTGTVYTSSGSTVAGSTVTTFANYNAQLTNNGTITTSYGLRLQAPTGTGTITNRYGISQEDTAAVNVLAGATRVGATTAPATNTLDVSTAGWGVKLATAPANGDANTLDCYVEANWTPTDASGAGMTLTQTGSVTARYTQIGRQVTCFCDITYPATILGGASAAAIALPVSAVTAQGGHFIGGGSTALWGIVSGANLYIYNFNTLTATTNTTLGASRRLIFTLSYFVS
jgi:hypothetical protein